MANKKALDSCDCVMVVDDKLLYGSYEEIMAAQSINVSEAFRVMIVKIDERLMQFLEGRSKYIRRKILDEGF